MERIRALFAQENIKISTQQAYLFVKYRERLLEYNQKFNLTAITDYDEITIKHFIDSALGHKYLKDNACVVDIGSGAGFPALPLKIINPTLKFTLLDAINKRVEFLRTVSAHLNLLDVECLHQRAEEHAKIKRGHYDFALARAVSSLATLSEYALPLLKVGGKLIAYKGDKSDDEIQGAKTALRILGGEVELCDKFLLNGQNRSFIVVKKVTETSGLYPRNGNKPKNNPL